MSTAVDNYGIVIPFLPKLFHLASVKIAFTMFNDFDHKTLSIGLKVTQNVLSAVFSHRRIENCEVNDNRLNKTLLFIPPHLRSAVVKAVHGMRYSFVYWLRRHSKILNLKDDDKVIIYFRSDGDIHSIKTAQHLVLNVNIDTIMRFDIACMYCFQENMQTLWAEMEVSGETKNIKTDDKTMSSFGVRWLRDGCRVPWTQAVLEYLTSLESFSHPYPRFSPFIPLLQSNNKQRFLFFLMLSTLDDIRFCLRTVNKEEKEQFLEWHAGSYLFLHLQWPMQSSFLEIAQKMLDYLSKQEFINLLRLILDYNNEKKDFNYGELFEGLWIRSPNHLRESAELCPILNKKIENYMREKRRQRKSDVVKEEIQKPKKGHSGSNRMKKWTRKNGRLQSATFSTRTD